MNFGASTTRPVASLAALAPGQTKFVKKSPVSDRCLVLSAGRVKGLLDRAQITEDNITALAIGQEIRSNG